MPTSHGINRLSVSKGTIFYLAMVQVAFAFAVVGCAAPNDQRFLGDGVTSLEDHQYPGSIDRKAIDGIDLKTIAPTTYIDSGYGKKSSRYIVYREKDGGTIREDRVISDRDIELTVATYLSANGWVYSIDLEGKNTNTGEQMGEETLDDLRGDLSMLIVPHLISPRAVLGKDLKVGKVYEWDAREETIHELMEDSNYQIRGASEYLGTAPTEYGEAAVFRERVEISYDLNEVVDSITGVGWRLIDISTGSLIEQNLRAEVVYQQNGREESEYVEELVEVEQAPW